jgi:hypothetical protein
MKVIDIASSQTARARQPQADRTTHLQLVNKENLEKLEDWYKLLSRYS